MAKGSSTHYESQPQRELAKLLRDVSPRHGMWQVWRDFVAMSALSISNAVDLREREPREAEYLQIASRYTRPELEQFARGLALVVEGLQAGHCDFLGSLFMVLELGNQWTGQIFSPYHLCVMMAHLTMGSAEDMRAHIERKGFITVNDPCVGGGAMVIAAADAMLSEKVNYQQHLHAIAQDIDIVAVHMSYVQLALLHIPAVVIHGNSLLVETRSLWRTPAHILGGWGARLRAAERREAAHALACDQEAPETHAVDDPQVIHEVSAAPQRAVLASPSAPEDVRGRVRQATREQASQFSLF